MHDDRNMVSYPHQVRNKILMKFKVFLGQIKLIFWSLQHKIVNFNVRNDHIRIKISHS